MRTSRPRADVAELLRQGATYRQIKRRLNVSGHLIAATRRAYSIPLPDGRRELSEQRVLLEQRVASLLLQGATYKTIGQTVGVSPPTVLRIRREWNIPAAVREPAPGRTVEETLARYTEPYGDGHVRWSGPHSGRTPSLYAEGRRYNARHVAFRAHHGRNPAGHVQAGCPETRCMAGAHLTDDVLRAAQPSGGEA